MDKNTVLKLAPNVLKRIEYSLERVYLLNFDNDEIWVGNMSTYLILNELDGTKTIDFIVKKLLPQFTQNTYSELYKSTIPIFEELLLKDFLIIC